MSLPIVLSTLAAAVAVMTALVSAYRWWRRRIQTAAVQPWSAGREALDAAREAIELKDAQITDMNKQLYEMRGRLAEEEAKNEAQKGQMTDLYVELGRLRSQVATLQAQLGINP